MPLWERSDIYTLMSREPIVVRWPFPGVRYDWYSYIVLPQLSLRDEIEQMRKVFRK